MTDEPNKSEMIYICGCGCRTWIIRADEFVECANCETLACEHSTGSEWRRNVMPPPDEVPLNDLSGTTLQITYEHAAFARASVMRDIDKMIKEDKLAFVMAYDAALRGRHWLNVEDADAAERVARQLEDLAEFVRNTKF